MENVIVLSFAGADQAREAVGALQQLHRTDQIQLEAAAIIERTEEGRTFVLEQAEEATRRGTAGGGVVGAVIGLLAGPLGVVLGGAAGAAVGSLVDVADVDESEDLMRWLGRAVPPGHTAAIGLVVEPTAAPVDGVASDLGVAVLRRPREKVETEIDETQERRGSGS